MRRYRWFFLMLWTLLWAKPAAAEYRFIVRSNLGSQAMSQACLLQGCTVVRSLDGSLNQLFLVTIPNGVDPTALLNILRSLPGVVDAELDQLVSLVGGLNKATTPPPGLWDQTSVDYFGAAVWNGYRNQPAAQIVRLSEAQSAFHVAGTGIVADIDTGVDPNHPALRSVLLPGYDFTRNQEGASELRDVPAGVSNSCDQCQPAYVNQSTAAMLDQSTAAMLDGTQYSAFGHGTMVVGIIHLVAPKAQILPLKAFRSDGSGYLSDILRAIYYAVENNANVINMSFDFKSNSDELVLAMNSANQHSAVCAASAGNDGQKELVYPAALRSVVMGTASTSAGDTRSSFSNYGDALVWVAAPGEAIITTYPFSTYAAGWGTSFSTAFVSGAGALLLGEPANRNHSQAASAVAHAHAVGKDMGYGRLDLYQALGASSSGIGSDFSVSASPSSVTITAGQSANTTLSVIPAGGFNQTVTFSCAGVPAAATCTISPSSVTLDGTNPATAVVTLSTAARSISPPGARLRSAPSTLLWACLGWLLAWVIVCNWSQTSPRRAWLSASVALLAVLCTSCGGAGGGGGGGQAPGGPPAASAPPSTITITGGSSGVSHATTVSLTTN